MTVDTLRSGQFRRVLVLLLILIVSLFRLIKDAFKNDGIRWVVSSTVDCRESETVYSVDGYWDELRLHSMESYISIAHIG